MPHSAAPPSTHLRLVFAGTPSVAAPALDSLVAAGHNIATVVTRQDAPLGRKRVLTPSPIATRAHEHGLHTIKANRLDDDVTAEIVALKADLGVIVAFGGLVREPLLSAPRLGWINLHFSLLPRWRGAAPVQRAIMAGDTVSGASVFQLVPELDAGEVFHTISRSIGPDETAGDLLAELSLHGAEVLTATVRHLAEGYARAVPQTGEVTLAPKLTIDDARLRWHEPAAAVYNRLRAVTPEPGAFTELAASSGSDNRLKILTARLAPEDFELNPGVFAQEAGRVLVGTATHPLELVTVQPAGKRQMPATDWWRGLGHQTAVTAR